MSEKSFALPPLGKFARVFPILIGVVVPIVMFVAIALAGGKDREWVHALPALLVMPVVALVVASGMHSRQVEILPDTLRVRRWPVPRSFALSSLEPDRAQTVDLRQENALQPVLKLMGSRMPGFRSGWFRLRDGRRGFVLTTSGNKALCLPRKDGSVLLLGVERPEALLQALRDDTGRRG